MDIWKYIDNIKKIFIKEENIIRRENAFFTKDFVHFFFEKPTFDDYLWMAKLA